MKFKNTLAALALSAVSIVSTMSGASAAERLYIAPNGNDMATGDQTAPMQSLAAACARLRSDNSTEKAEILVAPGRYYMTAPLVLTPQDSRPIEFRAADPSAPKPEFIGGISITGWRVDDQGRWRVSLPEVSGGNLHFEQLWINGRRATRARTPNSGWMPVESSSETVHHQGDDRFPAFATQRINVKPEYLSSLQGMSPEQQERVMTMFYHKWDVTRKGLAYVLPDSGRIFTVGQGMKPWNSIGGGSRFILENYLGALDSAGEWFLDSDSGELYYMPLPGESIQTTECIAPTINQLIVIKGEAQKPVSDKTFNGLSFGYTSYIMPASGNEPMQAAAAIEAAVMADYAHRVTFNDCELQHTGAYGIWLRRGCCNNTIERCYIADLGAGGIKIGEMSMPATEQMLSQRNKVDNNIITHAGYVFPCGVGVAMLHTAHNRVTHNEIADIRYSGISVGWFWGYNNSRSNVVVNEDGTTDTRPAVSPSVGNIVEFNHVHHIGWGELSDMGAVYTLGESPGTRVSNNVIHDIYSYDYGGWGLYTDEGSTGIVMENNLVYGCKSGGFHQHYGKENIIRNNIFAFNHYQQLQFTRVEGHRSLDFTRNIVLADCGVMMQGAWAEADLPMDNNIYWDLRSDTIKFAGRTFEQWQKVPRDSHSVVADPRFTDPAALDFTFRDSRAIRKTGFVPFDYTRAGVYGSPEWIERSKLDPAIAEAFRQVILSREKEHSRIYDK